VQRVMARMRRLAGTPGPRPALALCLVLLAAAAAGCGTLQVSIAPEVAPREGWTVWVLSFDDSAAPAAAADYTFYGRTGAQGSGPLLARTFATAFSQADGFQAADPAVIRRLMLQERLKPASLVSLSDDEACMLAAELGVDMVVRGRVLDYRCVWLVLAPKATVALEIRGLDARSGKTLWTAQLRRRRYFQRENRIASALAQETVAAIRARLAAEAAPGKSAE